MMAYVIGALIGLVVGGVAAWFISAKVAVSKKIKEDEATVGSAQNRAKEILDEANKAAEASKREALVEVKE